MKEKKLFKIEMIAVSLLEKEEFERYFFNALTLGGKYNVRGLVIGAIPDTTKIEEIKLSEITQ